MVGWISDGRETLTSREQTVLLQLAQGKSNREVAEALDISIHTVETHRKNIKRKLGINLVHRDAFGRDFNAGKFMKISNGRGNVCLGTVRKKDCQLG